MKTVQTTKMAKSAKIAKNEKNDQKITETTGEELSMPKMDKNAPN